MGNIEGKSMTYQNRFRQALAYLFTALEGLLQCSFFFLFFI